ncbi:DUF6308 family protein [Streptomyces sp. ID05-04B]|uniref:DUF6308 family protein n=1 Tax=unclassified Streptomyces TaxID=2593676 RepID=UPI000D1A19B4|nr:MULTISPECIES: DUF6308 family protein [unclassified Streptomyces]AVV46605.1 hypothetical protein C6376_39870 [Streptomyces sp. P3]MDX5564562.1 DUF6308 family protein [Streptomyces sp. ID05-04B]
MDAAERLAQKIETLSRMFTEAEPASLRTGYLAATPSAGCPVPQGSTATALVPRWNEHPCGLLVPATIQPPAPIDLGAAYLTPDEIFGFDLPADYAVRQLERLPLEGVIRFCAQVLNALELPGVSVQAVEAHFTGEWLDEPVRSRVRNLLRDETRRLLVPQTLMPPARRAMEVSPDTVPEHLPDGDVIGALFSLTQVMGRHPDPGPSVITDRPGTLGRPHPSLWLALHAALREDDHALHRQLLELLQSAGVPETVSALRVCDVAVWTRHRAEGHARPR